MTSRLPICFSSRWGSQSWLQAAFQPAAQVAVLLALFLLWTSVGSATAATLTGRVQVTGGAKAGKSLEGVAVWLVPAQGKAPAPAPQMVRVLQKGKRFSPHLSVIGVGWTVDWPNLDPIFHNAFSNFAGQPFDTGLYPPGGTQRTRFMRDGIVRVFCNIHSSMSAVIVVSPSPWFASSKPDGSFSISDIPLGEYVLRIWHERSSEATLRAAERRVTVSGDAALDAIALTDTGFVAPPLHKNKYGFDYPPEPPSKAGYEQTSRIGRGK